jgi:hypothetical protein
VPLSVGPLPWKHHGSTQAEIRGRHRIFASVWANGTSAWHFPPNERDFAARFATDLGAEGRNGRYQFAALYQELNAKACHIKAR